MLFTGRIWADYASVCRLSVRHCLSVCPSVRPSVLARDAQAKLALIVAQIYPSVHPSVHLSVRDSYTALRVASHVDYRLVVT